jgi:hypothetical protein
MMEFLDAITGPTAGGWVIAVIFVVLVAYVVLMFARAFGE